MAPGVIGASAIIRKEREMFINKLFETSAGEVAVYAHNCSSIDASAIIEFQAEDGAYGAGYVERRGLKLPELLLAAVEDVFTDTDLEDLGPQVKTEILLAVRQELGLPLPVDMSISVDAGIPVEISVN
jgi:hypothetical protein